MAFEKIYTDFSGGVNTTLPPIIQDLPEAFKYSEICENWLPEPSGLSKIPGYTAVLNTATGFKITGIFEYKTPGGVTETVVCSGSDIYRLSGDTLTSIKSGQTAGSFYQSTTYQNSSGQGVLLLCNGVDTPVSYDGTTCASIVFTDPDTIFNGATPLMATEFRGRLFYHDKTKVYTPAPGTFNDFTVANGADAFNVSPGFGGDITGLLAFTDNYLIIYKERCVRRLSGVSPFGSSATEPFQIAAVSNDFGCIAPRSIVQVGIDHYFLSEDGIRSLQTTQAYGGIDPGQPTYAIQNFINSLNQNDSIIYEAVAILDRDRKQIRLAVPTSTGTENNAIIILHTVTQGISIIPSGDIEATSLAVVSRSIYHGDSSGQVYLHGNSNSFNGANINSVFETKWICHGAIGATKKFSDIYFYTEADAAGDLVIQYQVMKRRADVKNTSKSRSISENVSLWDTAIWDVSTWAGSSENIIHLKNLGRGKAIKFRLINNNSTQRIKIRQINMSGQVFGRALG